MAINRLGVTWIVVLVGCVIHLPVVAQGDGPPPQDLSWRERIDWLVAEVGSSEDGTTVRESIQITDEILATLIGEMATAKDVEDLKAELAKREQSEQETIHQRDEDRELIEVTVRALDDHVKFETFALVCSALFAILVALGGFLFRLGVKVESIRKQST